MNKNIFIKILCAVVVFTVLATTFGCTIGGKKSSGNKDADIIDFEDFEQDNGTVVYTHNYTDKETGEKVERTEVVHVEEVNTPQLIRDDDTASKNIKDDFINNGKDDVGMGDDVIKDITEKPENWKTFYVTKYIKNKADKQFACSMIEVENNGEGGIWLKTQLGAEYSMAPGNTIAIDLYGMVDMSKFEAEEDFNAAFKKLKIKLHYTFIDSSSADVGDWNSVTTYAMDLN